MGCNKAPVEAEFVALQPTAKTASQDLAPAKMALLSDLHRAALVPEASTCQLSWQNYRIPPPTNLVIVLQQLLI
jgi:hypothetical protein